MNKLDYELAYRIGLINDILLTDVISIVDNGKSFDDEGE